jgi:hypothetical protein
VWILSVPMLLRKWGRWEECIPLPLSPALAALPPHLITADNTHVDRRAPSCAKSDNIDSVKSSVRIKLQMFYCEFPTVKSLILLREKSERHGWVNNPLISYSGGLGFKSWSQVGCSVKKKKESYPCNRPWRPIGLWDVEASTFSLDNRLTDGGKFRQPYAPAALYSQED